MAFGKKYGRTFPTLAGLYVLSAGASATPAVSESRIAGYRERCHDLSERLLLLTSDLYDSAVDKAVSAEGWANSLKGSVFSLP